MLCLALFFAVAVVPRAVGQDASSLAEVEKLIRQQDYSAALLMLAAIQRSNPDLRDQTSRLMAQIMAVTQRFNAALQQLNQAVQEGDAGKIETLLAELKRIDPVRAADAASQAGSLVGFIRLMDNARALLRAGKARDALEMYLLAFKDPVKAGVRLPQAEFEAAGYGEILTASVQRTVSGILDAAGRAADATADISAARPALNALLVRPGQDAAPEFDRLSAPLLLAALSEGTVRQGAASLSDISGALARSSGRGRDDPYLRFLGWIIVGRGREPEGIAYAIRRLWADDAQNTAVGAADAFVTAFESARSRFGSGTRAAADAELLGLAARGTLAAKAAALASAQFDVGSPGSWKIPRGDARMNDLLDRVLTVQEYAAEAEAFRLLISLRNDLDAMPAAGSGTVLSGGSAEAARLLSVRAALDGRLADARAQESSWTARARRWETRADLTGAAATLASSARAMAGRFRAFADIDLQPRDLQYALRIAAIAAAGLPKRLQDSAALRARAEDLKEGTVNGQAPAAGALSQKRPDQALTVIAAARDALDSLIADITAQQQQLEGERPWVKASPTFTALFEGSTDRPGYNALLQVARSERARIDVLAAAAQKQVDNAALSSREGDNNFAQAQAAIKRGDPDGASSSLELATAAYLKSLADAYTDHAFARTTTESDDLNARILKLQNDISVANAQKAIASINRLITAGDYLGASDALDAGVRAWNQTQSDTYPPFDNLRLTIQAAVELSQGRVIARFDPKADVVNAFIKNARDALAAGRLADAAQNVKDALAVAPNYGEAKVLELQIRKQTDPAGFQREAAAQIATYLRMSTERGNIEGQKTAYLALQDYSKLDPKFAAQTRATIQELAYTLGFQRRPPTADQVARSAALVRQANQVQQQGSAEAWQRALDLLKQALQVNPNNADAVRLDGEIRKNMGSTALAALSPADTQVYNQAFTLFLSGAYQDAYDRVLQIWDDPRAPRNKTYAPLLRLKKRLEVQLNIS